MGNPATSEIPSCLSGDDENQWLPACGISPLIPIDVAEHGWPTGPTRSYERQARAIETVIRTVWELEGAAQYRTLHTVRLRDADSSTPEVMDDIFHHFGITRDDYVPKPRTKFSAN